LVAIHVRIEALEHVADFLATDATVKHSDRMARAPAPAVDDDPIATIVIGSPLFSLCATRTSGLAKRIIENGASHAGAAGSPRAAKGKATTAMTAAAAIALLARLRVLDSLAADFMLTVVCLRCPMSQSEVREHLHDC